MRSFALSGNVPATPDRRSPPGIWLFFEKKDLKAVSASLWGRFRKLGRLLGRGISVEGARMLFLHVAQAGPIYPSFLSFARAHFHVGLLDDHAAEIDLVGGVGLFI